MTQIAAREAYLADLLSQCRQLGKAKRESCSHGLKEVRDMAAEYVLSSRFPTTKDEEWRFTDISPILETPFQVSDVNHEPGLSLSQLTLPVSDKQALPLRLVFVNGYYAPHLSSVDASLVPALGLGVFVGNLSQAPAPINVHIREYLGKNQEYSDVFSALNLTGIVDAAVIYIPKNQEIETPIHILYITMGGETPILSQPHCLVIAEPGSSVTLVEDYTTMGNSPGFTNALTQVVVGENAAVNHIRLQRETQVAVHIGKSAIAQARDSRYTCTAVSLGAKISRHNLEVVQTGVQTETTLNGLTMISGTQLADTHSAIMLNHPYGKSEQLQKNIIGDKAHAVFNGKICVPKPAQLTDAGQLNRNLLLSNKARVDTKPQLEITADNVKCSHGATVSQLEEDEVFYLQSRGIDQDAARKLLVYAFAMDILYRIPILSLRETLSQYVSAHSV